MSETPQRPLPNLIARPASERRSAAAQHCSGADDPRRALHTVLTRGTADLVASAGFVRQALAGHLATDTSLAHLREAAPAIDLQIRIYKQIAQLVKLDQESALRPTQALNLLSEERAKLRPSPPGESV